MRFVDTVYTKLWLHAVAAWARRNSIIAIRLHPYISTAAWALLTFDKLVQGVVGRWSRLFCVLGIYVRVKAGWCRVHLGGMVRHVSWVTYRFIPNHILIVFLLLFLLDGLYLWTCLNHFCWCPKATTFKVGIGTGDGDRMPWVIKLSFSVVRKRKFGLWTVRLHQLVHQIRRFDFRFIVLRFKSFLYFVIAAESECTTS